MARPLCRPVGLEVARSGGKSENSHAQTTTYPRLTFLALHSRVRMVFLVLVTILLLTNLQCMSEADLEVFYRTVHMMKPTALEANHTLYARYVEEHTMRDCAADSYWSGSVQLSIVCLPDSIPYKLWRHLYTSPVSAIELKPGKCKSGQAKINGLNAVTPPSIAYAALHVSSVLLSA